MAAVGRHTRILRPTSSDGFAITPMRQVGSFSAFAFFRQLSTHLEPREEKLCDFCIANVAHLSDARVVRARLQPAVATEGATYKKGRVYTQFRYFPCNASASKLYKCSAALLVPLPSLALPECAAILIRTHTHQRVRNVARTRKHTHDRDSLL